MHNIEKLYVDEKLSTRQINKITNIPVSTIKWKLRKKGILRTISEGTYLRNNRKNYPSNEHYFNSINSPDKAYYIGILTADGFIHKKRNEISLSLGLDEQDILCTFCNDLNIKGRRIFYHNNSAIVKVTSKEMKEDLKLYNIVNKKTFITKFPNINPEYYPHFIRGYMDGDGCISVWKKTEKYNCYSFSLVGTEELLLSIRTILNDNNIAPNNKLIKKRNSWMLVYSGNRRVAKILDYIYQNCGDYKITKKYNRYHELMKQNARIGVVTAGN